MSKRIKNKIMYHSEKTINGVLHFRSHPRGKWTAYTLEQLTNRVARLENELK